MSIHPLVTQLRFTRNKFVECLKGVSSEDGVRRIMPMNSISWIVGHLANQEQTYWVLLAQERTLIPGLSDLVGTGKPASTPSLDEMWAAWQTITHSADLYLDTLTTATLQTYFIHDGKPRPENIGTMLLRNIYHYWYHTGEAHVIRDMLGHLNLPQFVGKISEELYRPETWGSVR
jgi:uncharacterized damage-inducible protein DinB